MRVDVCFDPDFPRSPNEWYVLRPRRNRKIHLGPGRCISLSAGTSSPPLPVDSPALHTSGNKRTGKTANNNCPRDRRRSPPGAVLLEAVSTDANPRQVIYVGLRTEREVIFDGWAARETLVSPAPRIPLSSRCVGGSRLSLFALYFAQIDRGVARVAPTAFSHSYAKTESVVAPSVTPAPFFRMRNLREPRISGAAPANPPAFCADATWRRGGGSA